jgi:4'-phosphopantetheinyl transferase
VALGPVAVGIDAEPLAGDPSRFAAIREVCGRSAADVADGVEALRLWTTIEAVLKADGRGLDVDPRRVSVEGIAGTTGSTAWIDDGPRFTLRGMVVDGLVVSVAVNAD